MSECTGRPLCPNAQHEAWCVRAARSERASRIRFFTGLVLLMLSTVAILVTALP